MLRERLMKRAGRTSVDTLQLACKMG